MNKSAKIFVLLTLISLYRYCFAWNNAVSVGYAFPTTEVGYKYTQGGLFINGKLGKFPKIDHTLLFTIDGSVGYWQANTSLHNRLLTVALSAAFRAYFYPPEQRRITPFLLVSFGPNYLSATTFGFQKQGAHFDFQTTLGGGVEFTTNNHGTFDVNLRLIHFCNAGLFTPNEGFTFFYTLSVEYLF